MSDSSLTTGFQFDDLRQQRHADTLGMWIFLATEVLFFGALFLVYTVYRQANPGVFPAASQTLNLTAGTLNTAVLLTSSLTVALADHFIYGGKVRLAAFMLAVTLLLGLLFLLIKGYEYRLEFNHHLIPFLDQGFHWSGPNADATRLFFNLYFSMTGLHALHLLIGLLSIFVTLLLTLRHTNPIRLQSITRIVALYWHFVDLVWVFLFPLLYLVR